MLFKHPPKKGKNAAKTHDDIENERERKDFSEEKWQ